VVENIVYVGTDTVYHLNSAPAAAAYASRTATARTPHAPGSRVRVRVPGTAIRVLAE
jgi:spermidine/putrescine transport system ATP-binding protein